MWPVVKMKILILPPSKVYWRRDLTLRHNKGSPFINFHFPLHRHSPKMMTEIFVFLLLMTIEKWGVSKNRLCKNKDILLRERNIHSVWCNTRTNHSAIFEWVNQYWFPNWSDTIFCNWSKYFFSLIWSEWCGESAGQIANKALGTSHWKYRRKKYFTNSIASIFVREMATSAVEIYHFHEMVHFSVQIRDVDMQIFVGNCCQSVSYTLINIFFWNCSFSIFLILLWCWNVWRHILQSHILDPQPFTLIWNY